MPTREPISPPSGRAIRLVVDRSKYDTYSASRPAKAILFDDRPVYIEEHLHSPDANLNDSGKSMGHRGRDIAPVPDFTAIRIPT